MKLRRTDRPDFADGMLYSSIVCAAWIYAQSSFIDERMRKTLNLLLFLPLDPAELVVAKQLSLYSMVLVTINIPLIFLRDWHLLLLANASALLLSTLIMTCSVVSSVPLAGQIPIFFVVALTSVSEDNLQTYYPPGLDILHWVMAHMALLAIAAIGFSPVIAISSAALFKYRHIRRQS
jgi:hypothetical protein